MPLVTCPDCAREVSTEAPACIHCGRPMGTSSSPANLAARPATGIATALVLGMLSIVWVAQRGPSHSREMEDANALFNLLIASGNAVLLILALLSLWGHRWAHARIRGLSIVMILAPCGAMLLLWRTGMSLMEPQSTAQYAAAAGIMLAGTAMHALPWILYLLLFHESRFPWIHTDLYPGARIMRTTLRILPVLLLAACASAATGAKTYRVKFRADAPSSRHVLPYPAEVVWAALPRAYAQMQLPGGPTSRDRMEFTTPQLRVESQLYGRHNSDFMDCGVVDNGRRIEDHGEVMLAMITRLEAAPGGTAVMTQLDAYARRRDVASDPIACSTRGVLEEAVVAALLKHLQGASAAR
jgi:hypothetical protein